MESASDKSPDDQLEASEERDVRQVTVEPSEVGVRLDQFLTQRFAGFSRSQIRRAINDKGVQVDGRNRKPSHRVSEGETVSIRFPERQASGPEPEPIALDILFEDEHMVAVNKPIGMVVHPAKGHWQGTLTAALAHHFQQLSTIGGPTRPGIVHRLDRDTSGVILVAKTDSAHIGLAKQFEERTIEKEYFAIARGVMDRDRDVIDQPIGVHPYQREKMAIRAGHSTSRDAKTFYEVVARHGRFVQVKVFPKTGRTHQIRVHLAHIGCPVLCDPLYSGSTRITNGELIGRPTDQSVVLDRLALHARRIRFSHPVTRATVEVCADLEPALQSFIDRLCALD